MSTDFENSLRVVDRIRELMSLAAGNSNQHEAEQAMASAQRLAAKYGVDLQTLSPAPQMARVDNRQKGRDLSSMFANTIRKQYPTDDEDYTKEARNAHKRSD